MNIKYIISIAVLIFTSKLEFAQHRITGKITNENTSEPISGVSVYITDLKTGTYTDKQGNYKLENLKSGIYLVDVSIVGFKSKIQHIKLDQDTIVNFELVPATKELTEVIVTGVTRSTELKKSPIIIKSLDKNFLNQTTSSNLIDALKNVPGISQITTGASISKPIIRGLGYNRVISLYNGIRQEGQQWGDEHGIEIDEYSVDKIEIVKGPGSLMYGSDGIAGVVNFISPKAPPVGTMKTQLISNYQTNNNLIGYSISNAGSKNGFQWLGRFSNKFASNYQNKYDGKVFNSGFKEMDGSLFVGITKNWGHSHWHVNTYNNTLNLVEGERDSLGRFIYTNSNGDEITANNNDLKGYNIGYPHQMINHLSVSSNNYFILKKGTFNADLGFQNNKRKEFGDATNPNDIALFFDLSTLNYNLKYNLNAIQNWEISFGASGMFQANANKGLEFLIPEYGLFDIGGFVFAQKTFDKKLTFAGGIRFDNRSISSKELILNQHGEPVSQLDSSSTMKFNAFTKNFNGLSGSLGLSYQASRISTIKLNVSQGYRAPSLAELSSNGKHEGTFRYEIGNLNLKPEFSHQIDLAYFLNTDHFSFELTPFVNFISNYIYTEKLVSSAGVDSIPDPTDPAPAFQFTQDNATLVGGEIFVDLHPHPFDWLHIENSFSYVNAFQSNRPDSMMYLPFIPTPKYRGELKANFEKVNSVFSHGFIKFGVDYYFAKNNISSAYGTETPTPSFTLLSAGMGINIKAFKRKDFMSLFLNGENLANVAYQSNLSRLKYAPENLSTGRIGVFNMGRNFSLKMILNL